jgi:hypothetical protein
MTALLVNSGFVAFGDWPAPSLIQLLCNSPSLVSLAGERLRGQVPQGGMRAVLIVATPPCLDPIPSIGHRQEPRGVQAFRSQAAVERLDQAMICWLPRSREVDLNTIQVGPLVERLAGERRTVVDPQALGVGPAAPSVGPRPRPLGSFESSLSVPSQAPLACGRRSRSGSGTDGRRTAGRA